MAGFAGHEVLGTFKSNPFDGLRRMDLLDEREVSDVVEGFRPDAIVHSAARPSVDWCEEHPEEARRLNVDASFNLLGAATRVGARIAFISTDYVFDGESGPYSEGASVNPINNYGRLKREVETTLLAGSSPHVAVRTTNVYGYDARSKNFLMALLPRLAAGERVAVASDQMGTPTHVADLCASMRLLLEREVTGVVNAVGPDLVNRVDWLKAAALAFGLDPALVDGHETNQLSQSAKRPLRAGLKADRLRSLGLPAPRGLRDGLQLMALEKRVASVQAW